MKKEELLKQIFQQQRRNSKKRGHSLPKYSYGAFRDWALNDRDFIRLYNKWVDSGYEQDLRPSCDRIMDNHGYSFENIQWITYRENLSKPKGLQQKRIAMLDKTNSVIAVIFGANNASNLLNMSTDTINKLIKSGEYLNGYKYVELEGWK